MLLHTKNISTIREDSWTKMINWILKKIYIRKIPKGNNRKVFVGMSGGVDSSVSAAILKERGYDVHGVFIKVWQPDFMKCTWQEDKRDAMRICAQLCIPFEVLNLEKEYKENVVDYMISEYKKGRTPNPDVMCNAYVKFGGFYDYARKKSSDFVATGHYAQINNKRLLKGKDPKKDQSYFVWQIRKEQLDHIIFPIGHIPKKNVRKIAKAYSLYTANKKDSQGLCFIGHVNLKDFLSEFVELVPGDVLNTSGEVIGEHYGALMYTEGQREGFKVNNASEPFFVVSKDIENNNIVVSRVKKNISINPDNILLKDSVIRRDLPGACMANIRYHGNDINCIIKKVDGDNIECKLELKDDLIAPGQSVVLYDSEECIAGGIV